MKKFLVLCVLMMAIILPVSAATKYDAAGRVPTIGNNLLTKNGIPAQTIKFMVVSDTPDNSNYKTTKTVNISSAKLAYAGNDNEVAAVIANEYGHIIAGHAAKGSVISLFTTPTATDTTTNNNAQNNKTSDLISSAAIAYHSLKEEKEADSIATTMLVNASYNPLALIVVLTKQTGTYWDTIKGKPANADRAMNIYSFTNYAYPEKIKAGYGCNEYKNFLIYANSVTAECKNNPKSQAKYQKDMNKLKKYVDNQITKFKIRGGISGWDAVYGLLGS